MSVGVVVAVAMTNQIAIVVRLHLDDGRVTAHLYRPGMCGIDSHTVMQVIAVHVCVFPAGESY